MNVIFANAVGENERHHPRNANNRMAWGCNFANSVGKIEIIASVAFSLLDSGGHSGAHHDFINTDGLHRG